MFMPHRRQLVVSVNGRWFTGFVDAQFWDPA